MQQALAFVFTGSFYTGGDPVCSGVCDYREWRASRSGTTVRACEILTCAIVSRISLQNHKALNWNAQVIFSHDLNCSCKDPRNVRLGIRDVTTTNVCLYVTRRAKADKPHWREEHAYVLVVPACLASELTRSMAGALGIDRVVPGTDRAQALASLSWVHAWSIHTS